MTTKTSQIAGLAIAAVIGLGAISAQAAPFTGTNPAAGVASGIEAVSDRREGRRGGHRDRRRHGRRHRHPHRPHWRPIRNRCWYTKVRVYDPYYDEFIYRSRRVCRW
ncbi:MAG: hypothetical protein AcusKO_12930 [Acuticoccus sp.]